MRFILGSGSPRRKIILEQILGNVETIVPHVDETPGIDETPYEYTRRITELKLNDAAKSVKESADYILITSDTIVCLDNKILGKPVSSIDAFSMLTALSDREHFVLTGLSLELKNGNMVKRLYDYEKTSVIFNKLDDNIIEKYLSLINYSDKAGSYAVQEHGDLIVQSVDGSLTNVIGLPLRLFFRMMMIIGAMEVFMGSGK